MQTVKFNLVERLIDSARSQNLLAEAYSITGIEPAQMSKNSLGDLHNHYNTLIDAAISSANFRSKIFEPDYPIDVDKISAKVGYMNSPIDINTAIKGGFYWANFVGDYIDNYCILGKGDSILDFGCGSLRVSRYFMQFARQFVYFACDVNPVSISWAQRQFRDRGDIFGMDSKPPLVLGDESMDLVFAWSIFSHYSQYFQQIWITELNRILKPGGYLLISFQSDHLLNQMKSRDMVAETRSENVDLEEFSKSYHNAGFGFYKCYPQTEDNFGFDVENFGMAFISADYIRRNWQKLFDVVRIDAGIVGNFQDLVLLRKL